jgi:hypothetical protein
MNMSNFKTYKIFSPDSEVEAPFEYMRTLSNGEHLGALITAEHPNEQGMNQEEVTEYLKANHTENTEENE